MRISIFGLGYVGTVTAACLARDGHAVTGVDVNPDKVRLLAGGHSPIVEPGVDELLAAAVRAGRLSATADAAAAVAATEVSLVCVGTPATERGGPDLAHVLAVMAQIGAALRAQRRAHVILLRSTAPPGTLERCAAVIAGQCGPGLARLAANPEFLRESTAIRDFDAPPFTIIGTEDPEAERAARAVYAAVRAPVHVLRPREAELIKYLCNPWHAVKIAFANEIGRMGKALGLDARRVLEVFLQDTKLNISPAYLRPGFAYGGSCLPKDVAGLLHIAQEHGVRLPVIAALPASNDLQIEAAVAPVLRRRARRVAVLGLAFKAGTDDLRESPTVRLVKRLLGEGCQVRIYDPAVNQARLMGTNLHYIRTHLPHFEELMAAAPADALRGVDLAVAAQATEEFRRVLLESRPPAVLDLAGLFPEPPAGMEYEGVVW